jgi:hypothetical protein
MEETACIANIGPRERRKRMGFGVVFWLISAALAAYLFASGASRWWRLILFLPLAFGAAGFFQARAST